MKNQKISRRNFLTAAASVPVGLAFSNLHAAAVPVRVQRLNWSGIRFSDGNYNLFIDPVITDIWGGDSPHPMVELGPLEGRSYALITHTHGDHFDVPGLQKILGERGYVLCESGLAPYIASRGLKVIPLELFKSAQRGPFTVVPLPAVDGMGDSQVSWVVNVGGRKYIHCGDTLWHGAWSRWGRVYGPFDTAFLPINGAIQASEPPTEIPLSLTPAQAVDATLQLGARRLVPIHYGHHSPGSYEEFPDAMNTLLAAARRRQVAVEVLTPGQWLSEQDA